jgi:hypothetical protein
MEAGKVARTKPPAGSPKPTQAERQAAQAQRQAAKQQLVQTCGTQAGFTSAQITAFQQEHSMNGQQSANTNTNMNG